MSPGGSRTSSNPEDEMTVCPICGKDPICRGLGVIRYDVPMADDRFGKLFRCPNNPADQDNQHQEKLRHLSNLAAYADKTFANFETNLQLIDEGQLASLTHAYKAAQNFAENPSGWLLLEGTYGCGKTHLAAAVGNARLTKGDMVLFITTPDLLDHLRSAYGPQSEVGYDTIFDRVRNAPLLILDDLGVENPSPWAQEKLFQLLNHRYSHRIPTIITTNISLDDFDPRIRSRLLDTTTSNSVTRLKISAPDYRSFTQNQNFQLMSNLALYRDMIFESFKIETTLTPEVQRNLEMAWERAYRYAQAPQGWLIFMGGYGCGKTHLAAAIANHLQSQGEQVMFVTVPDLLDHLRLAYNPDAPVSFDQRFQKVRQAPLLVLDDLGTENATSWAREKLFQIIDYRYVAQLPTVITTAKTLENIDERISSRLIDKRRCTIFAITARSFAERQRNRQ